MTVSALDQATIAAYCRIIEDDMTETEAAVLTAMKRAAISYCVGDTGLTESELDEHEDITIAVLVLISDMNDNRQMYVDKAHVNRTADSILAIHRVNLLPEEILREESSEEVV